MTAGVPPAPVAPAGRTRHPLTTFLLSPVDPATWRAVFAIGSGLFILVFAISVIGTLFSVGGSLLIVLVGFLIVAPGHRGGPDHRDDRALADDDRRRHDPSSPIRIGPPR